MTNGVAWCIICKSARAERTWRSRVAGRARTIGNRVYPKRVSRVQIPPSPPKNESPSFGWAFIFYRRRRDLKGRHQCTHWCKKVSGGHFFSPWENPFLFGRGPSVRGRKGNWVVVVSRRLSVRWTVARRVGPRRLLNVTNPSFSATTKKWELQ